MCYPIQWHSACACVGHSDAVCAHAGTLKAWCHILEHYGTLPLATVMAPAIRHATNGFGASECVFLFVYPVLGRITSSQETRTSPDLFLPKCDLLGCVQVPRGYHQELRSSHQPLPRHRCSLHAFRSSTLSRCVTCSNLPHITSTAHCMDNYRTSLIADDPNNQCGFALAS